MKVQLLTTKTGLKSGSLKRISVAMTKLLGYKVWRTTAKRMKRKQFQYGDSVDKLEQYKFFKEQGLSALEYTTDAAQAQKWQEKGDVVGRKLLNASCGKGIVIFSPGGEKAQGCLVYTKYKKKKREFRIHVFKDKVASIVEKRKKQDWNGPSDSRVRNLANGYIFCQEVALSPELHGRIILLSLAAAKVCGSDFRGVDVGYNEANDDLFVIEVNSAPGIEGTNVDKYLNEIKKYV